MAPHPRNDWLEESLGALADEEPGGQERLARLGRQLAFLLELDRAKSVLRRTYLTDGSRRENDAEHMWHACVAALVLAEHADGEVDPLRLTCMLAVHDVVEIDAGDTFVYDTAAQADKKAREERAAARIFGLLPPDQEERLRDLWEEFEEQVTPTAKMAAAIDRLLPLLMNRAVGGRTWSEHGIRADRVISLNSQIEKGSGELWRVARQVLEDAVAAGVLEA